MCKLYPNILNKRIVVYMDINSVIEEEQNGFRKDRSCEDHIYSLTSIIRNRKNEGRGTYTCFIDMAKAFDRVNRDILFIKLANIGVSGNMLEYIKIKFPFKRKACQVYEGGCCRQVSTVVSLVDW